MTGTFFTDLDVLTKINMLKEKMKKAHVTTAKMCKG